jgi:transcriptional regulator with XRE-family HTH domain
LGDWMAMKNISQSEMARLVGTTEATISRVRRGINAPGIDIAAKIVELTENKVTLQDLSIKDHR